MEAGVGVTDRATGPGADLDERFAVLVRELSELPLGKMQDRCVRWKSQLDSAEARRLSVDIGANGDDTTARRKAGRGGRRSKQAARKIAKRAAAAAANPGLLDDVNAGELSSEQLDTIADAAAADPTAATDTDFIDAIKGRSVDQGRKLARRRKNRIRDGETDHERQRRLRRAHRFTDHSRDLAVIQLEGDHDTIDELWNLVNLHEQRLHAGDGGRDLPTGQHPRSFNQRLFDAAAELIRGLDPLRQPMGRPSVVISVGVDGAAAAPDGRRLSDSAVRDLLVRAGVSVQIVDNLTEQPLWHGQMRRNATTAQFIALVIRDGGCVQCGAAWVRCHAHHVTPSGAPARGETDIDNLALMCVDCHTTLHAANQTLVRHPDSTWTTRPATAAETPRAARRSRRGRRATGRTFPDRAARPGTAGSSQAKATAAGRRGRPAAKGSSPGAAGAGMTSGRVSQHRPQRRAQHRTSASGGRTSPDSDTADADATDADATDADATDADAA